MSSCKTPNRALEAIAKLVDALAKGTVSEVAVVDGIEEMLNNIENFIDSKYNEELIDNSAFSSTKSRPQSLPPLPTKKTE